MALGATDISMTAVYAELAGSSSPVAAITTPSKPWLLSSLVGVAGQNPFSFYGPWELTVDATTKVVEIDYGSSDYKLGDFREYNHGASYPTPPNDFTHYWGPGGIETDITIVPTIPELNILCADANATYVRYNAYETEAERAAAASSPATDRFDTDEEEWLSNTITPLPGHTRDQTEQIQPTHVGTFEGFDVSGMSGDTTFYFDMYFAASGSSTRLVSMCDTLANAYFDITLHEQEIPWADSVGTSVARGGYTGTHVRVNNTQSSCTGADVNQVWNTDYYSFYVRVVGIISSTYNVAPTSCTCEIVHYDRDDNVKQTLSLGSGIDLSPASGSDGVLIASDGASGPYDDLTNAMAYDDYLKFNVTAVSTWGTAVVC